MGHRGHDPEQFRLQMAFAREVADLRDVPLTEIAQRFSANDLIALSDYQTGNTVGKVIGSPLSDEFKEKYGVEAKLLAINTSTYEEETEDDLVSDPVIEALIKLRTKDPNNKHLTEAIRTRRSVAAFVLLYELNRENGDDHNNSTLELGA